MSTLKVNTLTDTAATKSVPIEDVVNGTARAWVNFNGASATSPFTIANGGIRAAYNVSSVTDNGTGDYTVNFTNAMPDANYVITTIGSQTTGNTTVDVAKNVSRTDTASLCNICAQQAATRLDLSLVCIAIFR